MSNKTHSKEENLQTKTKALLERQLQVKTKHLVFTAFQNIVKDILRAPTFQTQALMTLKKMKMIKMMNITMIKTYQI